MAYKNEGGKPMKSANPRDYYHPQDKSALDSLKQVPGFSMALKAFMKVFNENMIHGLNMSNKIRISDGQLPDLYRLLPPICQKLGIREPEFYLEMDPAPNAYTFGDTIISITVTSGLVDLMNEEEISTVLAHECGHIACHHVLYHTMARMVLGTGANLLGLDMLTTALQFALFHWERCSEFSCDRAAAIYMEDSASVARVMSLLASGSQKISSQINMGLYMEQAAEYRQLLNRSTWDKALQYLALMNQNHPFLSVRAAEIQDWCSTKNFHNIMRYMHEEAPDDGICPGCAAPVEKEWTFCRNCGKNCN